MSILPFTMSRISFPRIASLFYLIVHSSNASPTIDLGVDLNLDVDTGVTGSSSGSSSIVQQQLYNLCRFENALNLQTSSCTPYGTPDLEPIQIVATLGVGIELGTFVATPLTQWSDLPTPTTVWTTDSWGLPTLLPIGELGQGQSNVFVLLVTVNNTH